MIELIVKYVQDKGYEVDVQSGYLTFRKRVGDEICSISWGVSRQMLRPEREKLIYYLVDTTLEKLDRAIAENKQITKEEGQ